MYVVSTWNTGMRGDFVFVPDRLSCLVRVSDPDHVTFAYAPNLPEDVRLVNPRTCNGGTMLLFDAVLEHNTSNDTDVDDHESDPSSSVPHVDEDVPAPAITDVDVPAPAPHCTAHPMTLLFGS